MKKNEGRSRSEGEDTQSRNEEDTQSGNEEGIQSGNEEDTQNGNGEGAQSENKAEDTGNGRGDSGQHHPGYISRQEAAAYAGVSDRMIDRWAAEGHFPQNKIGGRVWIRETEFREWISSWKATAE